MAPGSGTAKASAKGVRQTQKKVSLARARTTASGCQLAGTSREASAEAHESCSSVIAGCKGIEALTPILEASVDKMMAVGDYESFLILEQCSRYELLCANVGASKGAYLSTPESNFQKTGTMIVSVSYPKFLSDVPEATIVGASGFYTDGVYPYTSFTKQVRIKSMGPIDDAVFH